MLATWLKVHFKTCLRSPCLNHILYDYWIIEQRDGVAIASPLRPTLGDAFKWYLKIFDSKTVFLISNQLFTVCYQNVLYQTCTDVG